MESDLKVYHGPWHDFNGGYVSTLSHKEYTGVGIGLGLLFGLIQGSVERLFVHLFAWTSYILGLLRKQWTRTRSAEAELDQDADANKPLLSYGHADDGVDGSSETPLAKTKRSKLCMKWLWDTIWPENPVSRLLSIILLLLGVGYAVMGAFVVSISTDDAALSGSHTCGFWNIKDDANWDALNEYSLTQGGRESRAGQYANDCYRLKNYGGHDHCQLFRETRIPQAGIDTSQRCPFVDQSYCHGTGQTAVKFTTNRVSSKYLGLNFANAPDVNRTTICVPLNMNLDFIEKYDDCQGCWGYRLGPTANNETYTFKQYWDPFESDVRAYTMSTFLHVYSQDANLNFWQPVSNLNVVPELEAKSKAYSVTLMFINSCRIFYEESSDDPIFPAQKSYDYPGYYYNQDSRARPLACIDWIDICPKNGPCYPPYEEGQDNNKYNIFARYAVNKSDTYHSIRSRGATGLDAEYKIRGDTSLPLSQGNPQWIVETWNLFNTSLARIQYDALDIANGTGHDNPLYEWKMPAAYKGKMCSMFTFQLPKGYDNIQIFPTVAMFFVAALIGLMGLDTKVKFNKKWQKKGSFKHLTLLWIEYPFSKLRPESAITTSSPPQAQAQTKPAELPPNNAVSTVMQPPPSGGRAPLATQESTPNYNTFNQTIGTSSNAHDSRANEDGDSLYALEPDSETEVAAQEQPISANESTNNPNGRPPD